MDIPATLVEPKGPMTLTLAYTTPDNEARLPTVVEVVNWGSFMVIYGQLWSIVVNGPTQQAEKQAHRGDVIAPQWIVLVARRNFQWEPMTPMRAHEGP